MKSVKGIVRSLLLLAGLACLPACASSETMVAAQPVAPTPVQVQPSASSPVVPSTPHMTVRHAVVVHFDKDSADIRAAAMQILYGMAQDVRGQRVTAIRVVGHTDASGGRAHNRHLSQRRAAAVADQLEKLGLRAADTSVAGAGEIVRANGDKTRGSATNDRRVEIVVEAETEVVALVLPPPPPQRRIAAAAAVDAAGLALAGVFPPPAVAIPRGAPPPRLHDVAKPAIKRDLLAIGATWLPPPVA